MADAATTPNGTGESSRRKSGRVVRKPHLFDEDDHPGSVLSNGSAKRKRRGGVNGVDKNDDEDQDEDSDSDESEEDSGSEAEEETRQKQRAQRKSGGDTKHAAKKAKTTAGPRTTLAIRSANAQKKSNNKGAKTQKARARPSQMNKDGLFAEVFGRGQSAEDAVDTWIKSVKKDNVAAIRDMINFIFECIGCEQRVTSPDIEDIDNVPNKLGDVLEEYAQTKASEYPLISKERQYAEFRTVLIEFFSALIKALNSQSLLYEQPEIYDNIHVWVATMSGAQYRPFRHTATVISLSMTTALCEVAGEIQQSVATTKTQLDTEKTKRSSNKGRLSTMQGSVKEDEKKIETIDALLRDAFDTVYVHRYRDVDEKVRVECVIALGQWLDLYRSMFLEGQYLRYLGWIMSDPNSPTRLEVVRVLNELFAHTKNVPALRAFTDRFRSRMVEMGARDADLSVRAESIELLDRLRNAELLEPDDIDTIGRLIFDSEARVRKAVAKFFVSNIEDLYTGCIEDWDKAQYKHSLPKKVDKDEYLEPVQAWIKFKCLAQTLGSYDASSQSEHGDDGRSLLHTDDWDSRYMLASQSIYPHLKELHTWESLAGYLMYDHSSISADSDSTDVSQAVQGTYKLAAGEEVILLDVLVCAVKMYLASVLELAKEKKGRTNASKKEVRDKQETAAHNLSTIIPDLLNRYGSTPQAATAILRLQQLLDVDLINDLQGGEATYSAILEDINKQFVAHSDRKVLAEASKALRAARSYEQSKEAADAKVQEIWVDAGSTLQNLLRGKTVDAQGTLDRNVLGEVVNVSARLASLASVSDCTGFLESKLPTKKQKGKALQQNTLLDLFLALVKRGMPDADTSSAFVEKEDQVCTAVLSILSFYFRWKVVDLKNAVEKNDTRSLSTKTVNDLASQRTNFIEAVSPVIMARPVLDPVRMTATLTMLDLFTLFATTKHYHSSQGQLDDNIATSIQSLKTTVPEELMIAIMLTHEKSERSLARKTNRRNLTYSTDKPKKQKPDQQEETQEEIERPPEDSDDELDGPDSDSEDDGEPRQQGDSKHAKKSAALLAEQSLCEITSKIVLGLIAGVIPNAKEVKARLQVNRTKLGKSYAQVIAYLDEKKGKKDKKEPKTPEKQMKDKKGKKSDEVVRDDEEAEPMELEDDEIVDVDDEHDEDGGEDAGPADEDNADDEQAEGDDDEIMGD